MGKLIKFLSILMMIDLFFIFTGQAPGSLSSILLQGLLDLGNGTATEWMSAFLGNIKSSASSTTGILGLIASAAVVTIGVVFSKSDSVLFAGFAIPLGLLAADLVAIAAYLVGLNLLLGTVLMGPIILLYTFTVLEWVRGKD